MSDLPGSDHSQSDPNDETSAAWSDLTDELLGLTERLRSTYRQAASESGPSEEEVRDAFRTIADAWKQLAGSVGAAIQDEDVKAHLKKAAGSLVNAVGASLSELRSQSPADPEGTERGVTE